MTLQRNPGAVLRRNWFGFYRLNTGYCPICQKPTIFYSRKEWLRDNYLCFRCRTRPRNRAFIEVLETRFPQWREAMHLHESSPGGASSKKISRECRHYIGSHFFPGVEPGGMRRGIRCENLEDQTFADESFDLVITQDVLEHVLHPEKAFAEIARTLKPGGAHLFTVPWHHWQKTEIRAIEKDGIIIHLLPPVFHGNPIDRAGSLVVTDWGYDLADCISRFSNLATSVIRMHDPQKGILGEFNEVFISQKHA